MTDGAERVARHHEAQRKRGLRLVKVWVPESSTKELQGVAKQMRAKAGVPLPADGSEVFPGWAYVRVERHEKKLQNQIRQQGGRWLTNTRLWQIRADQVDKLNLRHRLAPEPANPKSRN